MRKFARSVVLLSCSKSVAWPRTRLALAAAGISLLTACGGGGGGGSGSASTPPQGSSAAATPVVLTAIDIKPTDVLANTVSTATTVSRAAGKVQFYASRALGLLVGNAWAAGLPSVRTDDQQALTFKILDGKLQSLRPEISATNPADEAQLKCDLSTAEAKVNRVWIGDPAKGTLISNLTVPSAVNPDCTLTYGTADYLVTGDGKVVEMNLGTDQLKEVIPAGDEAFNQSTSILLVYGSGQIRAMDVAADGKATFTDLTADGAQILATAGSLAYDGRFLVGVSSDPTFDGLLIYERGSTSFKLLRPSSSVHYHGVFLDSSGTFVWNWVNGTFMAVDPVAASYTSYAIKVPAPTGLYGARGRSGSWFMSDRCVLWDMSSGTHYDLAVLPIGSADSTYPIAHGTSFARLSGGHAYCANDTRNIYVRMDLASGQATTFNTDTLGYFPKAFTMFSDHALVEVVNTSNSDRMYVELNFDSGTAIDRGVITIGTRKVVELMPFGSS